MAAVCLVHLSYPRPSPLDVHISQPATTYQEAGKTNVIACKALAVQLFASAMPRPPGVNETKSRPHEKAVVGSLGMLAKVPRKRAKARPLLTKVPTSMSSTVCHLILDCWRERLRHLA